MTDATPPPAPLTGAELDALLSAELDGDLAGAAADLGIPVDLATKRLAATPGAEGRRAAIARARDRLAVPEPPLADDERTRLVARALEVFTPVPVDDLAARRERRERPRRLALALAGSAAAAVVLGLVLFASLGSDRDDDRLASGARDEASGETLDIPDVGEASDQQALREKLRSLADGPAPTASPDATIGGEATSDQNGDATDRAAEYAATAQILAERDACISELAQALRRTDVPVLVADATFDGAPARVVVFQTDGRRLVVVYAPDDCTTLASQFSDDS